MNELYNDYARYFDKIFPADEKTIFFLSKHLKGVEVLDIGCGSVEYAIALSNKEYKISGIDLDSEMIAYAKKKNSSVDFKVQNMLEMDNIQYDSLYCIGNTLVHLPTRENIQIFLNDCYSKLKDGNLLIQIINYDRIIENHITSLPTIENEGIVFNRNYSFKEDKIIFSTTLKTKENIYNNAVELIPLRKDELEDMLKNAGFKTIKSFSGFTDMPYDKSSYALVTVASKI